jgi:ABC-2 type transport system permease protein
MGRILSIFATSLKIWSRQRVAVVVSLFVPVVIMTVFGFVFSSLGSSGASDADPIRALYVDEDHGAKSADLLAALNDLAGLKLITTLKNDTGEALPITQEQALAEIREGNYGLALVVPAGFSEKLQNMDFNGAKAGLTVLCDSSHQIDNAIFNGMLMQVSFMTAGSDMASKGMEFMGTDLGMDKATVTQMQTWMQDNAQFINPSQAKEDSSSAQASSDAVNQPDEGSSISIGSMIDVTTVDVLGEAKQNPVLSHQVAGVLTMFMLFSVAASGGSLLRERQNGTIRRILISSTSPVHYLLGKYLTFFTVAYLQTWIMLLAGFLIFKVDIMSHLLSLAVFGALVALAATSFGMLLAAVCRSPEQVSSISTLLILTMSAIGGSMVPREFMPPAMQSLGNFTFNGWAMAGFTGIFWYEKTLGGILLPCLVMAGIAAVLFLIAAQLFRSRLAY